jgi:hypothetical protein
VGGHKWTNWGGTSFIYSICVVKVYTVHFKLYELELYVLINFSSLFIYLFIVVHVSCWVNLSYMRGV